MRQLLERRGYAIAGEASCAASAIESVERLAPDAALVDIHLPDATGFEVAARLTEAHPELAVLLTSFDFDRQFYALADVSGARGFVPKDQLAHGRVRVLLAGDRRRMSPRVIPFGRCGSDRRIARMRRERSRRDSDVVSEPRELLRRLAAADERSLRTAMAPTPEFERDYALTKPALDRRTRVLVRLAALIAVGASTESLRWAVELASTYRRRRRRARGRPRRHRFGGGRGAARRERAKAGACAGVRRGARRSGRPLLTEQAGVRRAHDGLGPGSGAELAINGVRLRLDGVRGHAQLRRDLAE